MSEIAPRNNEASFKEVVLYSAHLENPEELLKFVVESFGDGSEGGFDLISKSRANDSQLALHQEINPRSLADEFMRRLSMVSPHLVDQSEAGRELLHNLIVRKLEVEAAEIKRLRLTRDLLGKRAEMVWKEEQVQEVRPQYDEQSALVDELVASSDPDALAERTRQIEGAMEEWVMALEAYDLALRELQLKPGETVQERLASFLRRGAVYDRANGTPNDAAA